MRLKNKVSYKITDEQQEALEMYFAKFPEKGHSDILRELLSNALGLNSHLSSAPSSFHSPKRSEEEQGLPQETQSVMQQAHECYYRAIDSEKNQWYCDGTKIPKIVCIRRQQRFLNFERNCYPKELKKKSKSSRRTYRESYEKKDSHYCVLEGRPVPLDDLPLRGCFTCPNQLCKEALRR